MSEIHVVAVVGNDIINDNRVKKATASSSAAGYRTTLVCYAPETSRRASSMGEVEIVRVPVPFHVRDRFRRVPSLARNFDGMEINQRHLAPRTAQLAQKRRLEARKAAGESVDRQLFILRTRMWVRRKVFFLRQRANAQLDRLSRKYFLTRTRLGKRVLRRFRDPVGHLLDYEVEFGPELVSQKPDLIHAHDFHMIGVAVNAARLLRAQGHEVKVLYDAHELVEGLSYPQEVIDGWLAEEGAYIHQVDAVIGVSQEQVERIAERYGLSEVPPVVMNAPLPIETVDDGPTLSDGIEADHILVYHGNVAEERGVFTLVDALFHLAPGVHVAFVAPPGSPVRLAIEQRADDAGLAERVHVVDFVAPEALSRYLGSGSLTVIPYLHTGNNDIALPNKLFESIQAGLPILASDMRALARYLADTGVGLVFRAGDEVDLAAKVTAMLEELDTYRAALTDEVRERALWNAQAATLIETYESLVGIPEVQPTESHITATDIKEARPTGYDSDFRGPHLVVGPRNVSGQAYRIARAVESELEIPATSFVLDTGTFRFPADRYVSRDDWFDPAWQTHQMKQLAVTATHVLTESGTGIYGALNGGLVDEQLPQMRAAGLDAAVLLHGSEIRDPRRHRSSPFSPYATDHPLIADLEAATKRLRGHLEGLDLPMFVTTPDLQADIDATWLPVVVDIHEWEVAAPQERDVPVVLHLPTNGLLKGSDHVDAILFRLAEDGVIVYDRRADHLEPGDVAAAIQGADIVIDGIVLGAYGVMSCQTMAAGRLAVANLDQLGELRRSCPIIDASPSSLEERIRDLVADRSSWEARRADGMSFVREYHDGRYSARQLSDFLGA